MSEIKDLVVYSDRDDMNLKRDYLLASLFFPGIPFLMVVAVMLYSFLNPEYQQNDKHAKLVSEMKKSREISSNKKP